MRNAIDLWLGQVARMIIKMLHQNLTQNYNGIKRYLRSKAFGESSVHL